MPALTGLTADQLREWTVRRKLVHLGRCELLGARTTSPPAEEDAILLRLDRHLEALSHGLGLPEPVTQLTLSPAVGLKGVARERRLADGTWA